jgi:hypothetical protein
MDLIAMAYTELRKLQRALDKEFQRRLHAWAANPAALTPEIKTWERRDLTDLCCDLHLIQSHRGQQDRKTYRTAATLLDVLGRELYRRDLMTQLDGLQARALSA